MSDVSSETHSALVISALRFIEAVNTRDWAYCEDALTEDFVQMILPPSLKRPTRDRAGILEFFKWSIALIPDFKVTVHDITEGPNKVWVYASGSGKSSLLPDESYANSYVLMFDFVATAGGVRITTFKEFVDSLFSSDYMARLRVAAGAGGVP